MPMFSFLFKTSLLNCTLPIGPSQSGLPQAPQNNMYKTPLLNLPSKSASSIICYCREWYNCAPRHLSQTGSHRAPFLTQMPSQCLGSDHLFSLSSWVSFFSLPNPLFLHQIRSLWKSWCGLSASNVCVFVFL